MGNCTISKPCTYSQSKIKSNEITILDKSKIMDELDSYSNETNLDFPIHRKFKYWNNLYRRNKFIYKGAQTRIKDGQIFHDKGRDGYWRRIER